MNVTKARLYFAEYRRGTLDARTSDRIRNLLESDARLRADYDEDTRLEALIGLKRFEQPKDGTFDTFLAEFHRRQRIELAKPVTVWSQVRETVQDYFLTPASSLTRYSAAAALLAVVLGLSLFYTPNHRGPLSDSASVAESSFPNVPVVLASNDAAAPVSYVLPLIDSSAAQTVNGTQNGFTRFEF